MKLNSTLFTACAAVAMAAVGPAVAQEEIVVGLQCDRTGPTQIVGVNLCPGFHDYIALVNSEGGIDGRKIRVIEIDNQYTVPLGVEAHQRMMAEGAVIENVYGTPIVKAVTAMLEEAQVPGTSPGFGSADAANGLEYPYLFPIAATYWSQAGGAVQFAKEQLGGSLEGKKIAYLFYDNPAGREPLPVFAKLQEMEGFEMREFAVPPPGIEMGPQILDITRRFRADFVISHLFGRSPSVQIREFKRAGYPLNQVVSFVWGMSEADVKAAGGWDVADGYYGLQFAAVGDDYEVRDKIRAMYEERGDTPPDAMASTAFYNRGVFIAATNVAALRAAAEAVGVENIDGVAATKGFESIKGLDVGDLAPPLEITNRDHEGGGWVKVFQVKDGKFVEKTDWFQGYRAAINELVYDEEALAKKQ